MSWRWLFDVEYWLLQRELAARRPRNWRELRQRTVSRLTIRLERRGRML